MRTLLRLLSTAAVSFTLSSAAAAPVATPATSTGAPESRATAPHAGPQTLLVRIGSVPRRSGGQFVRYLVFQRPGAVASEAVVSAAEASGGNGSTALTIADRLTSAGWEQICTLAAEESPSPATPMRAAVVTPASASSAAAESATPVSLAITPPRGNPVSGRALVVGVALPGAGPARLEMLDVMGRVITERDLGSMGAGRHSVDLSAQGRFAPGVYMLRVTQGGDARVARVTVID